MTREEIQIEKLLTRLKEVKAIKEAMTFNLPTAHFYTINDSLNQMITDVLEESKELNDSFKILHEANKVLDVKIKFNLDDK